MEQNWRAQEETLKHREKLLQSLEEARQSAQRAKEEREELKSARKQELEAQVGTRGKGSLYRSGPWRQQALQGSQDTAEQSSEFRDLAGFAHIQIPFGFCVSPDICL